MLSRVRRSPSLIPSENQPDEAGLHAATEVMAAAPARLDPAQLAIRLMLENALAAGQLSIETAARDGTVCLVVLPSAAWGEIAREAWRAWARSGRAAHDWHGGWFEDDAWIWWQPDEPCMRASNAADVFARAVWDGRHCAGFAADLTWLPRELVQGADHRLTLQPLSAANLDKILSTLFGEAVATGLTDEQAGQLTPRLLRLAHRGGQGADQYVEKLLAQLVEPATPKAPARTSPRAAPTLERLHGMDAAVAWGHMLARDLVGYRQGKLAWADIDHGCLLSGPPGCGKTLFSRALGETCNAPLISASHATWQGSGAGYQGDLLKAMSASFAEARAKAPSILFLDEIDSFPDRRTLTGHNGDYTMQVVNALLAEVDGVLGREGVVLVAACNHPDRLDPALVRSGRLDRHIALRLPDRGALARILREHLGDQDIPAADLSNVALAATGMSGADCERLVRGARRRARFAGRPMLLSDLDEELGNDGARSPADLWTAAVHEAGHAVAVAILRPGSLRGVSLRQIGAAAGSTMADLPNSDFTRSSDLQETLLLLLAGRAAEHEILGQPSSGAGGHVDSDLARATESVVRAVTDQGLDEEAGLIWTGAPAGQRLAARLVADPELADRVRRRLDAAYANARELLRPRTQAIATLAGVLVERRVIDGAEAERIIRGCAAQDVVRP